MSNKFIVSVANAIGRDPVTKQGIFYGKANLSSAFNLSMQETEVRGGINNALLFTYKHDRDLSVTIEQAIASQTFLALNAGSKVRAGENAKVLATDCVTFGTDGSATLKHTPTVTDVKSITIFLPDGRIAIPDSITGTTIKYVDGANTRADVVYEYMDNIDILSIEATTPPEVIDLTLIAEVRDSKRGLVEMQHINIPSFQIDGNYELSFSADGVSQEALSGKALRVDGETCTDGDIYAYVKWVPVDSATEEKAIIDIVTTPSSATLKEGDTVQLVTKATYGGVIAPRRLSTGLTYLSSNVKFTISATGLVTAGSGVVSSEDAMITITYTDGSKSYKDYVFIQGANA